MRGYEVQGKAIQIGPGMKVALKADQIAPRKYAVTEVKKYGKAGEGALVEATAVLTFKPGEVIGFEGEVPSYLEANLIDTETGKSALDRRLSAEAETRAVRANEKAAKPSRAAGDKDDKKS